MKWEYDFGNKWHLIDTSNPYFNRWEHEAGFKECFWKDINPNKIIIAKEEDTDYGY